MNGYHFRLQDYRIEPLTAPAIVTARILQFNSVECLLERQALAQIKRYPSEEALRRMTPGTPQSRRDPLDA